MTRYQDARPERPCRDGATLVALEPSGNVARLAALVPRTEPNLPTECLRRTPGTVEKSLVVQANEVAWMLIAWPDPSNPAMSCAQRLKRVFAIDMETCPGCGGKLRVIAFAEEPALITEILGHVRARDELGDVATRAPPVDRWRKTTALCRRSMQGSRSPPRVRAARAAVSSPRPLPARRSWTYPVNPFHAESRT